MKYIVIGDLHFGRKNNDMTWLSSQRRFFDDTLIPYLVKNAEADDAIVFVGDVFDSRSSINSYVAHVVRELFARIDEICSHSGARCFVIAGNHDYYSPIDTDERVNSIDTVIGSFENVDIVAHEIVTYRDSVFVPWYDFQTPHTPLYKKARRVFTHGFDDIVNFAWPHHCPLYCGHVHQAFTSGRIVCVGSMYALDFADADLDKSFVVVDEASEHITRVANNASLRYYRVRIDDGNTETFDADIERYNEDDYLEVYIPKRLITNDVMTRIESLSRRVAFSHFKLIRYDDDTTRAEDADAQPAGVDAIDFTKNILSFIPERLHGLFERIQKIYDENQTNQNQ